MKLVIIEQLQPLDLKKLRTAVSNIRTDSFIGRAIFRGEWIFHGKNSLEQPPREGSRVHKILPFPSLLQISCHVFLLAEHCMNPEIKWACSLSQHP